MSHELVIDRERRAAFCYNHRNGNPWHQLGERFDRPMTKAEALKASRADRLAFKVPLTAITPDGVIDVESHRAVVWRNMYDDGFDLLGVVSKDYHLVQYDEVTDLAYAILGAAGDEALLDTMGLLFDGKRFFGFIDFGDLELVLPNGARDPHTRGLGFMSAHDGSQSVTFANSRIRWVCNNTVTAGLASAKEVVRVRHTANADERLLQATQLLGLAWGGDEAFTALACQMGGQKVYGNVELERLVAKIWPLPPEDATERARAIWQNRKGKIEELYHGQSCEGAVGPNRWALFNAVTEFLDHRQGNDVDRRARNAIDPASTAAERKRRAAKVLLEA